MGDRLSRVTVPSEGVQVEKNLPAPIRLYWACYSRRLWPQLKRFCVVSFNDQRLLLKETKKRVPPIARISDSMIRDYFDRAKIGRSHRWGKTCLPCSKRQNESLPVLCVWSHTKQSSDTFEQSQRLTRSANVLIRSLVLIDLQPVHMKYHKGQCLQQHLIISVHTEQAQQECKRCRAWRM